MSVMRLGLRGGVAFVGISLCLGACSDEAIGTGASRLSQATAVSGFTRLIVSGGVTSLEAMAAGGDALQAPEIASDFGVEGDSFVNRSGSVYTPRGGSGSLTNGGRKAKSNPEIELSFDGLNFRDQRLAGGGNQFSVEPPDQALCVSGTQIVEVVNDVVNVFDKQGNSLLPSNPAVHNAITLNSFYGYPPAINRATGVQGPVVTDPVCHFDPDTQRFYVAVLTLDTLPNGDLTGKNHLDLAVSNTSDATATWTIYRIPVQDDGTDGTPDHGCIGGPCIGDYPHIGADRYGIYLTTNEYDLFGPSFHGAQIYALSKDALASGASAVAVTQFDTSGEALGGQPGFTVWPALTPDTQYADALGGTEYFLSSMAAEEATGIPGGAPGSTIGLWALSNTSSLSTDTPALVLRNAVLPSIGYDTPPKADQKPGPFPLGECINDTTTTITSLGTPFVGCWRALFADEPAHDETESRLDANDTRMQQVFYANGKVWGALDTVVNVDGVDKAGIAYFVVHPTTAGGTLSGTMVQQGRLALAGNNLTYPTIAVTPSGRGVMSFTVIGADHYPSMGYASIDAAIGAGDIHIAAEGAGPDDGFTGYKAFVGDPPRTRWGDYGAAAVDGNSIWFAGEYIAQTCGFAQYIAAPFGSCGGTRASFGNWATRITKVTP